MKNPIATFHLNNGKEIVVELLPEVAYNEVCSFIHAANDIKAYNNCQIKRIVPGSWIDVSWTAYDRRECQYMLPNTILEETGGKPLTPKPGTLCMGGFSPTEVSGTEIFFPLKECDFLAGGAPVLGNIIEGIDELYRLEKVKTYPVIGYPVEINTPLTAEIIVWAKVETFGEEYPLPKTLSEYEHPIYWPVFTD